jgi:hypothetical protein
MGLGTSLFLVAAGAVLRFAVTVQTDNVNLHTIGVILMIVGAVGVVLSLLFWDSWGGWRRTTYVEDSGAAAPRRRVIREERY